MNRAYDMIHRFTFAGSPVRGQWVRLSSVLTALDRRKAYPPNVRRLLGEMLAAVAMVADGLKFTGAVSLQSRGRGPVNLALAECRNRHLLRGFARWEEQVPERGPLTALLGDGQLALSLIPDGENPGQTYQGLVRLAHSALADSLEDESYE